MIKQCSKLDTLLVSMSFKDQIKYLSDNYPDNYSRMIKARPELYKFVFDNTPKLANPKYQISTKCNWILNGITDFPHCNNPLCEIPGGKIFDGNIKVHDTYPTQCRRCNNRANSPRTQHARETNYERFGSYTNMGTELFKQQAIEGFIRHYGTTNNMKSEVGYHEYLDALEAAGKSRGFIAPMSRKGNLLQRLP